MDDVERRIRSARPDLGTRHDALTPRAEADFLAITRARPTAMRSRRRWIPVVAVPSLAAAVAALVAVAGIVQAPQVSMAAPPPLEVTTIQEPLDVVIARLRAATATMPAQDAWPQDVSYEAWFSEIHVDEHATSHYVQPVEVDVHHEADGSGTMITRAGDVRWGSAPPDRPAQPQGTLLEVQRHGAGRFPLSNPTAPPTSAAELRAYLGRSGTASDASTGDIFTAISNMADQWRLDGPQTAAVLELIGELPGVTVAGQVTDRLGRAGIALQTQTRVDGAFRDTLVFDATTGRLLSAEEVYLGGVAGFDLPFPTVFAYVAWKEPE